MPIPGSDNILALYAVKSNSEVAAVGGVNVIGVGNIFGAREIVPLRPIGSGYSHSLTLGIDYKDLTDTVNLGQSGFDTPITYVPFLAQYSATQIGKKGTTQFTGSLNFAPRSAFLGNTDDEFENKRFKARASYVYFRGDISRTQVLPARWGLYAAIGGQLASEPLVSSEQFAAGGVDTVRGYLESEILGDSGIRGRLELRTPPLSGTGLRLDEFYGLAFFDGAEVSVLEPLPGQISRLRIASGGLGMRMRAATHFNLMADVGWPLKDTAYTHTGDPRVQFSVAYEF
jgi:hemolysin activation/secretion protein